MLTQPTPAKVLGFRYSVLDTQTPLGGNLSAMFSCCALFAAQLFYQVLQGFRTCDEVIDAFLP